MLSFMSIGVGVALVAMWLLAHRTRRTPPAAFSWDISGAQPKWSDPMFRNYAEGVTDSTWWIRAPGTLTVTVATNETYTFTYDSLLIGGRPDRVRFVQVEFPAETVEQAQTRALRWCSTLAITDTRNLFEWWEENRRANQVRSMHSVVRRSTDRYLIQVNAGAAFERSKPVFVKVGIGLLP